MLILLWGGPDDHRVVEQDIDPTEADDAIITGHYSGGLYRIVGRLPEGSPGEYLAGWSPVTAEEMNTQIAYLRVEHHGDLSRIEVLEGLGVVDRGVITQHELEGVINRAQIVNLENALASCRRIGAAMGIIMTKQQLTEEQAFMALRRTGRTTDRTMVDLAHDILGTESAGG
jgi:hypothetical protein